MLRRETQIRARLGIGSAMLLTLAACSEPPGSPEAAVRAWVAQGHELVEAKDRGGLVDMISPAYTDARGNTRDDIENLFRLYFLRQDSIELLTRISAVNVFDDSAAEVTMTVGMAGTNDGLLGISADAYNFELELIRDGDDWLLISGRWGEVGNEKR